MPHAWIETQYSATENRTEWRIVVDGKVVHSGKVDEDITGMQGHDEAHQWASRNGVTLEGWKHATEHGMWADLAHSRTSTDHSAPMRLYGWAVCTNGEGREAVAVSAQQMRDLQAGTLPCPVCGEGCGATLEPTDVTATAANWNGSRWH